MSTATYKVGEEIARDDTTKWLVVRLIERDTSLVVTAEGFEFLVTEAYAMLKNQKGEIDFVTLLHNECKIDRSEPKIPALPSLWRHYNETT